MKPIAALAIVLVTASLSPSFGAAPLHVSAGKPLTRVKDVLADLSQQSGVPILADDTVVDTIGVTAFEKTTIEDALNALVPLGQGMTWQRVSLPQDTPMPTASVLAAQVRLLKDLTASGLVVMDPASPSVMTFSKSVQPPPSLDGMKIVYLVTNEVVRAQRLANQKTATAKKDAPPAPVDHAVAGMQTAADDLGKMTADQQRQAIPLMFQQMMRMFQSIDPAVRAEMRQQFQPGGGQGGGFPNQ